MKMILQNKTAVIFNGPPGSGKDMICDYLSETDPSYHHVRFKDHLFTLTKTIYQINDFLFDKIYQDRIAKEQPNDLFNGLSARRALIYISEDIIKPNFGKNYFGLAAANKLKPGVNCFSDGGFVDEIEPIYEATDGHMIIIQIEREGCNFSNDSRRYIDEFKDVPVIRVNNNGTKDQFIETVLECLNNQFEVNIYWRQDQMNYTKETKLVGRD